MKKISRATVGRKKRKEKKIRRREINVSVRKIWRKRGSEDVDLN